MTYFGYSFGISLFVAPLPGILIQSLKRINPKTAPRNCLKSIRLNLTYTSFWLFPELRECIEVKHFIFLGSNWVVLRLLFKPLKDGIIYSCGDNKYFDRCFIVHAHNRSGKFTNKVSVLLTDYPNFHYGIVDSTQA